MAKDLYGQLLDLPSRNYYEILGLPLFESDQDTIHKAVLQQTKKLRRWALDPDASRADRVQELLNEVNRAGVVLEDPEAKADYDRELADRMGIPRPESRDSFQVAEPPETPREEPTAAMIRCPGCGAHMGRHDRACPICGYDRLVAAQTEEAQQAEPEAGEEKQAPRLSLASLAFWLGVSGIVAALAVGGVMLARGAKQEPSEEPTGDVAWPTVVKPPAPGDDRGEAIPDSAPVKRPPVLSKEEQYENHLRDTRTAYSSAVGTTEKALWEKVVRCAEAAIAVGHPDVSEAKKLLSTAREEIEDIVKEEAAIEETRQKAEAYKVALAEARAAYARAKGSKNEDLWKGVVEAASQAVATGHESVSRAANLLAEAREQLKIVWIPDMREVRVATPTGSERRRIRYFKNFLGMEFVGIPPGEFMMGSVQHPEEVVRQGGATPALYKDEHPRHRVRITKPFCMGAFEVTQEQYKQVMGNNPSHHKDDRNPVHEVSWDDALRFCKKLSKRDQVTYRLPTEAEWEYACRAGSTTPFHTGETISEQAVYDARHAYADGAKGSQSFQPTPVGSFPANAFGLYDMHGNVCEWCQDKYAFDYSALLDPDDPKGPKTSDYRVLRGGSWSDKAADVRSAERRPALPNKGLLRNGFRVVVEPPRGMPGQETTGDQAQTVPGGAVPESTESPSLPACDTPSAERILGLHTRGRPLTVLSSIIYDWNRGYYRIWYHDRFHGNRYHAVRHAFSSDGIHWEDCSEVTFEGRYYGRRQNSLYAPIVHPKRDGYMMWVQEHHRSHAGKGWIVSFESSDGLEWSDRRVTLKTTRSGWRALEVIPKAVVATDSQYQLYCVGTDPRTKRRCIGRAVSSSGTSFRRVSRLTLPWSGGFTVARHGQRYYLFYTKQHKIVRVTSSNGLTWRDPEVLLRDCSGPCYFYDPQTRTPYLYYYERLGGALYRTQLELDE